MPTQNVLNRNFESVFSGQVRYEIPFFQRGYAWTKDQWKQLLSDIEEQVLTEVENANFEDTEHFFGPVVVLEKINGHPSLKQFLVIDGQQRITTVYLLLAVIRKLLDDKKHLSSDAASYSQQLEKYLVNDIEDPLDSYLKLKAFSSKGDRLPTYLTLFGENPVSPFLAADQQLYIADQNNINALAAFLGKALKSYDVPSLWNLACAVKKSLKIVWIPLDERKDDPQAIFESLNDKGMPLSASELLCNYLFKPLIDDADNNHEKLHTEKWLKAQKEVGIDNFETFLRNLFSISENKMIGKDRRLYIFFKNKNRKLSRDSALGYLNLIHDNTKYFKQVIDPIKYPVSDKTVHSYLIKINQTNMASVYPFLMALLRARNDDRISLEDTQVLLREVYVLLVRRKVAGLPTTSYDTMFPSLLDKIINEPDKVRAFHEIIQREKLYVPDQVFVDAFVDKELYNRRELNFTRHVLQELDKHMQTLKELPDYTTIDTIEHILPQTLTDDWKTYLGVDALDVNLWRITNTIGNLSLHSREANSSFGQQSFENKQKQYTALSALARDVKARTVTWNISAIRQRSADLAKKALEVWAWKQ